MKVQDVSYMTNQAGEKTGVFIPMQMFKDPEYLEDLYDLIVAKSRENEESVSFR